jgi:hypothetical protein
MYPTTDVEGLCKKLRPVVGRQVDKLRLAYYFEDAAGKREIEEALRYLYEKMVNSDTEEEPILLVPPSEQLSQGDYFVGRVKYGNNRGYPFCLTGGELIQHLAVFGRTGAGKTNAIIVLIQELLKNKKPFLIFDWKRNYRDLLAEEQSKNILVFTVGRDIAPFRFNPLIPPEGTQPSTWLKKLIEIIANTYYLGEGVMYLLQKAIDSIYRQFGVYSGNVQKWPTMRDVLEYLKNYDAKGREANWMTSTLRAISVLCFGEIDRVVNAQTNTNLKELLEKNIILELDALTKSDKTFLVDAMLLWIHHQRLIEGKRETFKHAIIIEEAHNMLLRHEGASCAVIETLLREIRELGEAIILIDQMPSMISTTALANTNCTICLNLKEMSDVTAAANMMLLQRDEKQYLGRLEVGQAIVKLQSRYFLPFLVEIPHVKIKKGVITDSAVREYMKGYYADSTQELPSEASLRQNSPVPAAAKVTPEEKHLLADILLHNSSGMVERYNRLMISRRKGNWLKDSLIRKGFVTIDSLSTPTGTVKILKLSEAGKECLRNLGYKIGAKMQEPNGTEHKYWKERIADTLAKLGYEVTQESPINCKGKTVDILAAKDGKKTAIEIETGRSAPLINIKKNLKADFDTIIVVVTNAEAKAKIYNEVVSENLQNEKRLIITDTAHWRAVFGDMPPD